MRPNHISLFSFALSLLGAAFFALGGYVALALGGVLAHAASVLDGCDGEVARLKYQTSAYGGWLDAVLDRYADAFLLLGLTWHVHALRGDAVTLLVGVMAVIGSFMGSYTADRYDSLMQERIAAGKPAGVRLGRDVRTLAISVGALADQALATLALIAAAMNAEAVRRVLVCRDREPQGG